MFPNFPNPDEVMVFLRLEVRNVIMKTTKLFKVFRAVHQVHEEKLLDQTPNTGIYKTSRVKRFGKIFFPDELVISEQDQFENKGEFC